MGLTLLSLPPEVLLEILEHLHRAASRWGRLGWFLERSPLLEGALVSRAFRALSQRLLFEYVTFTGHNQLKTWVDTPARKWTTALAVRLDNNAVHAMATEPGWFERWLRAALEPKRGARGGALQVLEVSVGSDSSSYRLNTGFANLGELEGECRLG